MRKNKALSLIAAFACGLCALALSVGATAFALPIPDPGKLPVMVTVSIRGDTEMGLNWNTTDYAGSDLEVVPYGGSFAGDEVLRFTGSVALSAAHPSDGYIHKAAATGLLPGTKYAYRAGDAEFDLWQEGSFTTPKESGAFSFVHVSDPQGTEPKHYETYGELLRLAVSDETAFIAATGDIVNNSWAGAAPVLEQWTWALTDQVETLKDVPFMAVAGNHDAADYDFSSRFHYAAAGDERTGSYYSFDYADAHFVALNTNDTLDNDKPSATGLSDAQMTWLAADLEASKDAAFKIVLMHKGIFDSGAHSSNLQEGNDYDIARIRAQLAPLFTRYGVDLVLQGHDHLYSRSYPISAALEGETLAVTAGKSADAVGTYRGREYPMYTGSEGAVYLNTGSASGSKYYEIQPYDPEEIPIEETASPKSPMYTNIRVDGGCLFADTYLIGGGERVPFKSFGIYKSQTEEELLTLSLRPAGGGAADPKGLPGWAIVLIVGSSVVVLAGGGAAVILIVKKRKSA